MLGEFIISILVLVLGYVYPSLECFKTIESSLRTSRPDVPNLLFWCQYWVILALMTAIEKFADIFISWLPLYGEFKLAFIVYLWHPRTKGTTHVYYTLLRPFMAQHEMDIERRLQYIMSKSIDLFLFYIKNFADKGQSMAFEILQYVISLPSRSSSRQRDTPSDRQMPPPPPPQSSVQPSAPPLQPMAPSVPPLKQPMSPRNHHVEPSRRPLYPSIDGEGNLENQVNRVEEALRAAGVNLRKLRQQ